jgi:hypothetical protein
LLFDWGSEESRCVCSGGGEKTKGFSERNCEKEQAWHQRRNGDGYPDLLSSFLDCFDKVSMNLGAYGSRLLSDEVAEIAGITVQCENANKSPDSRNVGSGCPFAKRSVFIDSVLDARYDSLQIPCNRSIRASGESLKSSAE